MPNLTSRSAKISESEVLHHPVITDKYIVHRRWKLVVPIQSIVYLDDRSISSQGEVGGEGMVCAVPRRILQQRAAG